MSLSISWSMLPVEILHSIAIKHLTCNEIFGKIARVCKDWRENVKCLSYKKLFIRDFPEYVCRYIPDFATLERDIAFELYKKLILNNRNCLEGKFEELTIQDRSFFFGKAHGYPYKKIRVSEESARAFCLSDQELEIWDLKRNKCLNHIEFTDSKYINDFAVDFSIKKIFILDYNILKIYDFDGKKIYEEDPYFIIPQSGLKFPRSPIWGFIFDFNNNVLIGCDYQGRAIIWNTEGERKREFVINITCKNPTFTNINNVSDVFTNINSIFANIEDKSIHYFNINGFQKHIFFVGKSGSIEIYDYEGRFVKTLVRYLIQKQEILSIRVNKEKMCTVTTSEIAIWNEKYERERMLTVHERIFGVCMGNHAIYTFTDNSFTIFTCDKLATIRNFDFNFNARIIDHKVLEVWKKAFFLLEKNHLAILDLQTGKYTTFFISDMTCVDFAIHNGQLKLYVGTSKGDLKILDFNMKTEVKDSDEILLEYFGGKYD